MGVKITGVSQLLTELEGRFNQTKIKSVVDKALTDGSLVFGMELRRQLATFSDGQGYSKGYTLSDMTITEPSDSFNGNRAMVVHWNGPHSRYRIIHLNEWGTILNPHPAGFGKIAKAMEISQGSYGRAVGDSIRRNL